MQNNSTIKSLEQAIKSFFADSKSSRRYNIPIMQKDIEDLAQTLLSEFEIKEKSSSLDAIKEEVLLFAEMDRLSKEKSSETA